MEDAATKSPEAKSGRVTAAVSEDNENWQVQPGMKHDKLQERGGKAALHSIEESDDICRGAGGNSPDSLQDVLNVICIRTNHKVSTAKSFPFNEHSEGKKKYQSQLGD